MSEFKKLRLRIEKSSEEQILKEEMKELLEICTNREQRRYCRIVVENTIKMALAIGYAEQGRGLNFTASEINIGTRKLIRWLNEGEEAIDECDLDDLDYKDHENYPQIQFFFEYTSARHKKNNKREDNIDAASEDITDKDGNVIMRGAWGAARYMLEKKNKEEYADIQEISNGGLPEGSGVLIINNHISENNLTDSEKHIELEKMAASSQSLTQIELKKESDKIK